MKKIIIGTRPSRLAMAQANIVVKKLQRAYSGLECEIKKISTKGDRKLNKNLSEIKSKGFFVKEIEIALLNGEIDLAVHSCKDLPTILHNDVIVAAIADRANPLDTLVSRNNLSLAALPLGAKLGTGSLRRKSQLLAYRNDFQIIPIRGNVESRIKKIKTMDLDGVILAAAGLERLGLENKISEYLDPDICLPAARQGAIAVETRKDDKEIFDIMKKIENRDTADAVKAEHFFLEFLQAGCRAPIGCYAKVIGEKLIIRGVIGKIDGSKIYAESIYGPREEAKTIGKDLARKLLCQGADKILAKLNEEES